MKFICNAPILHQRCIHALSANIYKPNYIHTTKTYHTHHYVCTDTIKSDIKNAVA